jgi:phosphonate transport system substrate-binding protein
MRTLAVAATLLIITVGWGAPRPASADDSATATNGPATSKLVVGRVSNNPRKDYAALKGLADYLVTTVYGAGAGEPQVKFADDSDTMLQFLREGSVDVVFDTMFPALTYEQDAGAHLLLREWRDGLPSYRSILFKRKDVPVSGVPDLVGRTVAFERPGSTSAYFVPRAEMTAAGLTLEELKGSAETPEPGRVGYVFAGSENNIVVWVHRRLVAAGAFSDIDWEQSEDVPPVLRQDLEVFHQSAPLPRALVLTRAGLPADIEHKVRQALLLADSDPVGQAALKAKHVARYDELVGEAAAGVTAARRLLASAP